MHSDYQSRQDAKSVMHLLRSALRQPRMETSSSSQECTTQCVNASLYMKMNGILYKNTSPRIISLRCYFQEVSEAFGWTRNNSECFFQICQSGFG